LTLSQIAAVALAAGLVVAIISGIGNAGGGVAAAVVGLPLIMAFVVAVAYLYAKLVLAPVAIVLENKGVVAAVKRSFALSRNRFWRILGTVLLAGVVVAVVSAAISVPFDIAGQVISAGSSSATIAGIAVSTIGQAIGRVITAPFVAGVVTLLYTDARIRSEAFDFTLLSAPPSAADSVWLSR
jgi:membrane-anchored glycerophosphoryl diester phosphodiesterase (GDPDase)